MRQISLPDRRRSRKFAHEVALQIAAGAPKYIRVEDVPAEVLEQERKARDMARAEGKPEKVVERIIEGKLEKFFDDNCLLRQTYVRDENMTLEICVTRTLLPLARISSFAVSPVGKWAKKLNQARYSQPSGWLFC